MIKIHKNFSLKDHNTFGLDVKSSVFLSYDSESDLSEVICKLRTLPRPWMNIGRGSNLLFTKDYNGTILHSEIRYIHEIDSDAYSVTLQAGAGVLWDDLCAFAAEHEYYGIENLSYIPGDVGSAAVQNIGAYGGEASQVIQSVRVLDTASEEYKIYLNHDCSYAYRDSIFKKLDPGSFIVVSVVFRLSKEKKVNLEYGQLKELKNVGHIPTAQEVRRKVIEIRKSKLPEPSVLGSAGSFFKNPVVSREKFESLLKDYPDIPHYEQENGYKIPAAYLIEQCGWKGKSRGGAAVYDKQPLIIVNKGNATPDDIVSLASDIKDSVMEKYGIQISPEVNYL
jgi:UDP-N-acetylmuramate dehydrogenase